MADLDVPTAVTAPRLANLEFSEDLGPVPEFQWINATLLDVDLHYQRSASETRSMAVIRKIAESFSWAKFAPITVTATPNGRYLVVDGQHRAKAALLHPNVVQIPCWLISAQSSKDQAKAFIGINRDRTSLHVLQIYKAELAAGDPDATQIRKIATACGVTIAFCSPVELHRMPPRTTQSVSTLKKLLRAHGEKPLRVALTALAEAYPDTGGDLRGQLIEAATLIVLAHGPRLDAKRLASVLSEQTGEEWIEHGRLLRKAFAGKAVPALIETIIRKYDNRLPPDRRLGKGV